MWLSLPIASRPDYAISAFSKCDGSSFPVLSKSLQIHAIQPVTTATVERSFSNLRKLKTWLRSTISEDRLTCLSLLAINNEKLSLNDAPEILNRFATKKARRLGLLLN